MKIDSHIDDRAYLLFNFYTPGSPGGRDVRYSSMKLGFMENVRIQESQQSRLTTYQPIGRNGNTFIHMGSDSRKFTLSFNLTLPNIIQYTRPITYNARKNYERKKALRESYQKGEKGDGKEAKDVKTNFNQYIGLVDQMFAGYLDDQEKGLTLLKSLSENSFDLLGMLSSSGDDTRVKAVGKVLQWLNLIRSSTLNYSSKPQYGPPLIRLTHGIVYQNVPCIATNYSITVDGEAGYDNRTLLPRVIKVTMNLSEVRVSSDKRFDPAGNTPEQYDADVGWEVIQKGYVSYNRIDDESIMLERQLTALKESGVRFPFPLPS